MSGQELYERWRAHMLNQGCETDTWEALNEDLDQLAWNALAEKQSWL